MYRLVFTILASLVLCSFPAGSSPCGCSLGVSTTRRLRGADVPVRREKTQSGADAVWATECALNVGAVLTGLRELHGGRGV